MKEIPVPGTYDAREKKKRNLRLGVRILGISAVIFAILAVLCLLGVFFSVIVAEFNRGAAHLCYYLAAGFGGGGILFALLAFLMGKFSGKREILTADFCERCDGEDSFFVGDGTLATFEEGRLRLHDEDNKTQIEIPYAELRAFSVCSRIRPCERGRWSVILEIPRRYIMKEGTFSESDPPALIQTDAKERLLSTLEKFGIELFGERQPSDMPTGKRFEPLKRYYLPDRRKRTRALLVGGLGLVAIAAGILLAFLFNVTAGVVCAVFGAFLLARSVIAFVQARGMLAVYREGIYWRETVRRESAFLKWEEVEHIERGEHKGFPVLTLHCIYADFYFPEADGVWEYLIETHREKCDA